MVLREQSLTFPFKHWQTADDVMVLPCDFATIQKQKNRLDKVSLISKKI
jgi:hypothetical protein